MSGPAKITPEAMWDHFRRDRRFRAWMAVNAPEALGILDHERGLLGLRHPDLEALLSAHQGYHAADAAALALVGDILLALDDRAPSGPIRAHQTLVDIWAASGCDPAELDARSEAMEALVPLDDSDYAVEAYLSRYGLPNEEIAALLAAWPRDAA
jgi:hypothetical protein